MSFFFRLGLVVGASAAGIALLQNRTGHEVAPAPASRAAVRFASLPIAFEPNSGQTDPSVRFVAHDRGVTVFVRPADAVLAFRTGSVGMRFEGARPDAEVVATDELPGKANYLLGNDRSKWRTDVATFRRVECRGVWPGIDVAYHGTSGGLEYDFVVSPGADPGAIGVEFDGADSLDIDASSGDLVVRVGDGELRQARPLVYQDGCDGRSEVDGRFVLRGDRRVGFEVAGYDSSRPLVIDPVLGWSTYLGGRGDEAGTAVATDETGAVYFCGFENSFDFPIATGSVLWGAPVGENGFLAKMSPGGTCLEYATHFGGMANDRALALTMDSAGSAYVCGTTNSTDFPLGAAPLDGTLDDGVPQAPAMGDGFAVKFDLRGRSVVWSTYLGGPGVDDARGIAVNSKGQAIVVGTCGAALPDTYSTAAGFQPQYAGGNDAYVIQLDTFGNYTVHATYLGGDSYDFATGVATAPADGFVVTGGAYSTSIGGLVPVRPHAGQYDLFVARFGSDARPLWQTFLGGSRSEPGYFAQVDLDAVGDVFVATTTDSADFPITVGAFGQSFGGGLPLNTDAVVAKLSGAGALLWASYLGGEADEYPVCLAVDRATGEPVVAGGTSSTTFPQADALPGAAAGQADGFVTRFAADGTSLRFSSWVGTSGGEWFQGVAIGPEGSIAVTGASGSTVNGTPGAFQRMKNWATDALAARLTDRAVVPDTISLVVTSGRILSQGPGVVPPTDSIRVSGTFRFRSSSPDRKFDPAKERIQMLVGHPADPQTFLFHPSVWKSKKGRHVWKGSGYSGTLQFQAKLVIDTRTGRFSFAISPVTFPYGNVITGRISVGFVSCNDVGRDTRTWRKVGLNVYRVP